MNCYKCGGTEDLSIKARNRDGTPRMWSCRGCRRQQYRALRETNPTYANKRPKQTAPDSCYRCGGMENLQEKDGWKKRLTCITCLLSSKTEQIRHTPLKLDYNCSDEWLVKAKESQQRILARFS